VALCFGAFSLATAFVAEYLGGVLQASLTIFGVVGGPLLALFTLGMFSTAVEEKGALIGVLSGLVFSLWIGFGGPKPFPARLSQEISGCLVPNITSMATNTTDTFSTRETILTSLTSTLSPTIESMKTNLANEEATTSQEYFPLYSLSFMWYAPIGFLVTILTAQMFSRILSATGAKPSHKIDEQLLSPLFPQCFRSRDRLLEPMSMQDDIAMDESIRKDYNEEI